MPTTSTGIPGATTSTSGSSATASTSTDTTTANTTTSTSATPVFSSQIKSLSYLNPETTTRGRYLWKMECYFRVNNIIDDKTTKTLLFLVIGDENEALIWNGCGQLTFDDLDFADLCKILNDHYAEKKSEIAVRYEFFSRKQIYA